MNAIVQERYGLRNLRIMDVPEPVPGENQILVRVHAAALNYAVMFKVIGKPFLARLIPGSNLKPRRWIPGGEISGRVEAVGAKVRSPRSPLRFRSERRQACPNRPSSRCRASAPEGSTKAKRC